MTDSSQPISHPVLLLPPYYLADISYYALVNAFDKVVVDSGMRFDKRQKAMHRCVIADTHGVKQLTVPISKPVSMTGARWSDILISDHGAWWHVHWETLRSAYGRTPFFEFYVDDFAPLFTAEAVGQRLCDFNSCLDGIIRRLLYIGTDVTVGQFTGQGVDCRRSVPLIAGEEHPYYQVRALSQGFLPGMSVLDLLFNLGPEASLYLDALSDKARQRLLSGSGLRQ